MKKTHLGRIGKTRQIIIHIYIIEKQDKDNVKKGNKQALFKRIFPSALLHDKKACRRIGSML